MIAWQVRIPLKISTALVVLIELLYGTFVFPPLTSYAAYLDARRWHHRFRLRNRLAGSYTVGLVAVSVAVAVGFAFSLDATQIPTTKRQLATTVDTLTNFTKNADNDLAQATSICSSILLNSTVIYRKPVLYRPSFRSLVKRSGNTRFDRLIGSSFASCTGQRLGETLPSDERSRETVQIHTECCETCAARRAEMKLFITVFASTPNNTQFIQRHICSTQDTPLLRYAFAVLKAHNYSLAQPYLYLHNSILPSKIWELSGGSEVREYVYRVDQGTQVGWSALLNVLLFLTLIPYAFDAGRWRRRGIRRFHGLGEADIAAWWALARAQGGGAHVNGGTSKKFRIACAQLGCKELEENLDNDHRDVFQQERLTIVSVAVMDENDNTVPMYKCPICGDVDDVASGLSSRRDSKYEV